MTTGYQNKSMLTDYTAVRDGGAGLMDLSARGRLLVSGSEAVQFLNGLITNDMKVLAPNSWMPAAFANVQGRLLAAIRVIHRDDGFLIDTENATELTVIKLLERFTLAGDFHLSDLSEEMMHLSVQGAGAAALLGKVLNKDISDLNRTAVASVHWESEPVTVFRATHTAEDGFDLLLARTAGETLRDALLVAGAIAVSDEVQEVLRIEGGLARYGLDMDESNVVTETNLDEAVSFTKGCYLGQEIIVRIKHRGHVAKKLAGVVIEEAVAVEKDAKIFSADQKEIGRITSTTFSPRLNRVIALGYVKYDYLGSGTEVKLATDAGEIAAQVAELPFIRGSWYSN
ncbi:MAG TPA: glycine cleavage T C-terminal barrel domain-containing protein [Pyrinomonadaceae bacterium]|nr:glycine cleavage T C-terminal barrel domain-containing protein [Pyrinomonadaceae bacterium]